MDSYKLATGCTKIVLWTFPWCKIYEKQSKALETFERERTSKCVHTPCFTALRGEESGPLSHLLIEYGARSDVVDDSGNSAETLVQSLLTRYGNGPNMETVLSYQQLLELFWESHGEFSNGSFPLFLAGIFVATLGFIHSGLSGVSDECKTIARFLFSKIFILIQDYPVLLLFFHAVFMIVPTILSDKPTG